MAIFNTVMVWVKGSSFGSSAKCGSGDLREL